MSNYSGISRDLTKYLYEHGTSAERTRITEELEFMSELTRAFPGSQWEPIESLTLTEHVIDRCEKIAQRRFQAAKKLRYRDHQGKKGRTLAEERATVRAQVAAQLMLGLPVGKPDTYQEARKVGNIGGGCSAFLPKENVLAHHLIVGPRVAAHIACFLVVLEGEYSYRLPGWVWAHEAQVPEWLRVRQREGGESRAYWVPVEALRSVREWHERDD